MEHVREIRDVVILRELQELDEKRQVHVTRFGSTQQETGIAHFQELLERAERGKTPLRDGQVVDAFRRSVLRRGRSCEPLRCIPRGFNSKRARGVVLALVRQPVVAQRAEIKREQRIQARLLGGVVARHAALARQEPRDGRLLADAKRHAVRKRVFGFVTGQHGQFTEIAAPFRDGRRLHLVRPLLEAYDVEVIGTPTRFEYHPRHLRAVAHGHVRQSESRLRGFRVELGAAAWK
mmetsp:Transcript_13975/g.58818  ORF Transcript_13975/g.58818 Transcript_13975/m.58818 type:complete len:235 (+) Transcript_13975:183-887(+)